MLDQQRPLLSALWIGRPFFWPIMLMSAPNFYKLICGKLKTPYMAKRLHWFWFWPNAQTLLTHYDTWLSHSIQAHVWLVNARLAGCLWSRTHIKQSRDKLIKIPRRERVWLMSKQHNGSSFWLTRALWLNWHCFELQSVIHDWSWSSASWWLLIWQNWSNIFLILNTRTSMTI